MCTTAKAILIARWIEQIGQYKFAKIALNKVLEIFLMHKAAREFSSKMKIHTSWAASILQETIQLAHTKIAQIFYRDIFKIERLRSFFLTQLKKLVSEEYWFQQASYLING